MQPPWTLTGRAALCAHTGRWGDASTVDLVVRDHAVGHDALVSIRARLRDQGWSVDTLAMRTTFVRLGVTDGAENVHIELRAEPVAALETPWELAAGLFIDTPYELLVATLVSLQIRCDSRDLSELRALLDHSGDLPRALIDAPRKDGGFSPQSLAWVLDTLPRTNLTAELDSFRKHLIDRLLA
jgi:hypothetical protein